MDAKVNRRVRWISSLIAALSVFATAGSWWYTCGFDGCPSVVQLRAWQPTEGGMLLDRHNLIIGALAPVKRINVSLTRVPPHVRAAFVAVEDRRFYTHHGIDWHGVARAAVSNVRAGGIREGASTITMQLARNVFLGHRASERSMTRKLLEWRYATLLESALSKNEILERYLNAIYLGNGVYGVEGASRDLFGRSVRDISVAEAALLAGLPKAPSSYTPRHDAARARTRRDIVLNVMEREHVVTARAIAAARLVTIVVPDHEWEPRVIDSWALDAVRSTLDSLRKANALPVALNDGQLRVRSTFDRRAQFAAERAIASGAGQVDNERGDIASTRQRTQGALVALDPNTGAVRAIVGGRRIERRGFNRALHAQRQPGSAFKPFVYAAALMHGFTPATMVNDAPLDVSIGRDTWAPTNYGNEYAGRLTLRDALSRSANAATVRVSQDVGISVIAALAHAQGISSTLPLVPALALGAGAVTPLELTAAYAPFTNGGLRVVPYIIERVEDVFGRVLWSRPIVASVSVLQPTDAFLITSLLQSVVNEGTGRAVRLAGVRGPVGGKTGTTNDGADVWFVGFTPSLVASVWFGADEPTPLGDAATGGRLAAPIWARFIKEGWHSPEQDSAWRPPVGIELRRIDISSGKLSINGCGPSRTEFFRTGSAPREECEAEMRVAFIDDNPLPDLAAFTRDISRRVMNELHRAAQRQREQSRVEQRQRRQLQHADPMRRRRAETREDLIQRLRAEMLRRNFAEHAAEIGR